VCGRIARTSTCVWSVSRRTDLFHVPTLALDPSSARLNAYISTPLTSLAVEQCRGARVAGRPKLRPWSPTWRHATWNPPSSRGSNEDDVERWNWCGKWWGGDSWRATAGVPARRSGHMSANVQCRVSHTSA